MTVSICLRCGEQKAGVFTPCRTCQYDPARETDRRAQARTLWLSDQHLKPAVLEKISRQIKAGEAVAFEEQSLDALVVQLRTQQIPVVGQAPVSWGLLLLGLAMVIVLVTAGMIALYFYSPGG